MDAKAMVPAVALDECGFPMLAEPAEKPVVIVTGDDRTNRAALQIAQALGMALATTPSVLVDNWFPRKMSREEAMEAFKPTAEDERRVAAAQAKRDRRAAKLRGL